MKAVLFDVDGVLIDSLQAHAYAFADALREKGFKFEHIDGEELPYLLKVYSNLGKPAKELINFVLKAVSDSVIEDIIKRHRYLFFTRYKHMVKLKPYVKETLKYLKNKGIKLCIVSSDSKKSLMNSLNRFKIKKYFDVIISADDVTHPKPDPEGIFKAVGDEKDTLLIGDMSYDVEAAKNAGIKSALVLGTLSLEEAKKLKPDFILKNLYEVKNIIT